MGGASVIAILFVSAIVSWSGTEANSIVESLDRLQELLSLEGLASGQQKYVSGYSSEYFDRIKLREDENAKSAVELIESLQRLAECNDQAIDAISSLDKAMQNWTLQDSYLNELYGSMGKKIVDICSPVVEQRIVDLYNRANMSEQLEAVDEGIPYSFNWDDINIGHSKISGRKLAQLMRRLAANHPLNIYGISVKNPATGVMEQIPMKANFLHTFDYFLRIPCEVQVKQFDPLVPAAHVLGRLSVLASQNKFDFQEFFDSRSDIFRQVIYKYQFCKSLTHLDQPEFEMALNRLSGEDFEKAKLSHRPTQ